jgi:hypothetical protein
VLRPIVAVWHGHFNRLLALRSGWKWDADLFHYVWSGGFPRANFLGGLLRAGSGNPAGARCFSGAWVGRILRGGCGFIAHVAARKKPAAETDVENIQACKSPKIR